MARGRKPRTWVKMDCEGLLRGSINYLLELDGQAVWLKMIALSEVCGGRPGFIEDNDGRGLPHPYIAHELHCTVELFGKVLETMKADGAIEVNGTGSIELLNFKHYQFSEYDRQKPYRKAKEVGKQIHKFCHACGYKARTDERFCPQCAEGGTETELEKDYTAGKYGHMVNQ